MAIGFFGDVVFETSDEKILNFSGFNRNVASRYSEHDIILRKPKLEYVGPGLDKITFTVNLNGRFGVNPRDEMTKWTVLAREGQAHTLVIGRGPLGVDKWVVESVSQTWDTIFNQGELYSGKIDIVLKEYVSTIESTIKLKAIEPAQATSTKPKTGTVTATVLNVREGPGMSAEIIGKLIKGATVTIIGTSDGWYQINFSLGSAYVASRYVKVG